MGQSLNEGNLSTKGHYRPLVAARVGSSGAFRWSLAFIFLRNLLHEILYSFIGEHRASPRRGSSPGGIVGPKDFLILPNQTNTSGGMVDCPGIDDYGASNNICPGALRARHWG